MAVDSSIALQGRGPNILGALQQGVNIGGMIDRLRTEQRLRPENEEFTRDSRALQLKQLQANLEQTRAGQAAAQITNAQNAQNFRITQAATAYQKVQSDIDGGNYQVARGKLVNEKKLLNDSGVTNTPDIDAAIGALDSKDPMQILGIKTIGDQVMVAAQQRGLFKDPSSGVPAEEQAFESLIKNFTHEQQAEARLVKSGLKGRATGSAVQTIAQEGTAGQIAATESIISGGKEEGTLKAQLKFKPQIARAVNLAQKEATALGETLTDLKRSQAAMPGLIDVVDQLKELAPIATSTLGGKAFDFAVKESGFGSTSGSTAKAKFAAIINNQVLPLLKQTFGSAFTESEGNALKATMGDVDASPAEKIVQLNAFIEGKVREIEAKERELVQGTESAGRTGGTIMSDANGNKAMVFPDGSFEEIK